LLSAWCGTLGEVAGLGDADDDEAMCWSGARRNAEDSVRCVGVPKDVALFVGELMGEGASTVASDEYEAVLKHFWSRLVP
jgi:hypothetical protein